MPILKYKNENFFQKWSPSMAYLAGYIMADAAVTIGKRGNSFLDFQSKDEELIQLVKKLLQAEHKITRSINKRDKSTRYRIQVGSRKIVDDLSKLGIGPQKTERLQLPDVPNIYFPDFLRGYFDGDGNVSYGAYLKKGRIRKSISFSVRFTSGSKEFLEQLKHYLKRLSIKGALFYDSGAWRLSFGKNASYQLFNLMYNTNTNTNPYFLRRKYKTFLKAMGR